VVAQAEILQYFDHQHHKGQSDSLPNPPSPAVTIHLCHPLPQQQQEEVEGEEEEQEEDNKQQLLTSPGPNNSRSSSKNNKNKTTKSLPPLRFPRRSLLSR
jgi:hypothetical protein